MENSSQDVSPFAAILRAGAGIFKVELVGVMPGTVIDDVRGEPSGNRELKGGEISSGVVTDEDDGEGGGTMIDSGRLSEERRIS